MHPLLLVLVVLAIRKRGALPMQLKAGVDISNLHPAMVRAAGVVAGIYSRSFSGGYQIVITSGREGHAGDGVHKSGSFHYPAPGAQLQALDFRTRDLSPMHRAEFAEIVAAALGDEFDVINHPTKTDPPTMAPHLHVEYDP